MIRKLTKTFFLIASYCIAFNLAVTAVDLIDPSQKLAASAAYNQNAAQFRVLTANANSNLDLELWLENIARFEFIAQDYPNYSEAPKSLYNSGVLYNKLAKIKANKFYQAQANLSFERLIQKYPSSSLADDALFFIAQNHESNASIEAAILAYTKLIDQYPNSDFLAQTRAELAKLRPTSKSKAEALSSVLVESNFLQDVQFWGTKDWSRLIFKTSQPVSYKVDSSKTTNNQNLQLNLNLENLALGPDFKKFNLDKQGEIKRMSIKPKDSAVLASLELSLDQSYKIYQFENYGEYKLVIDFSLEPSSKIVQQEKSEPPRKPILEAKAVPSSQINAQPNSKTGAKIKSEHSEPKLPVSISRALGLKVKVIIIDPGHGGKDPGATHNGLLEKDINLDLALRIKKYLNKRYKQIKVYLTREKDEYLSLVDRSYFANQKGGDLFVSIHTNASNRKELFGIETYTLNLSSDERVLELAALENRSSMETVSKLDSIVAKVVKGVNLEESLTLGALVQASFFKQPLIKRSTVDLGLKHAPFIVLIDTNMPSILVEVGFLSNAKESQLLKQSEYIDALALSFSEGLVDYISAGQPSNTFVKNE